jgi:hypothetical protein
MASTRVIIAIVALVMIACTSPTVGTSPDGLYYWLRAAQRKPLMLTPKRSGV